MSTKISDGIQHAIEQARLAAQDQNEKTAASNPKNVQLGSLLKQAAENIRGKGVDVRISDLQNLESIFRGQ